MRFIGTRIDKRVSRTGVKINFELRVAKLDLTSPKKFAADISETNLTLATLA